MYDYMLITEMLEIQHLLWRSERTHAECEGVRLDNANFKPKISKGRLLDGIYRKNEMPSG